MSALTTRWHVAGSALQSGLKNAPGQLAQGGLPKLTANSEDELRIPAAQLRVQQSQTGILYRHTRRKATHDQLNPTQSAL